MKIIVPCDFSDVVSSAMDYALNMLRIEAGSVVLLHVYDKSTPSSAKLSLDQAQKLIERMAAEYTGKLRILVEGKLVEGSLSETIAEVAEDAGANFVIMGTHGIKGMQKFFGSKAIKVVANSTVPFVVVQAPAPDPVIFKHLLMPLGPRPEEVEKINWAVKFAHAFGSDIHVVVVQHNDSTFQRKTGGNLTLLKRVFDSNTIKYEVEDAKKGAKLPLEMERIAREKKCDTLLITITQSLGGIMTAFDPTDQQIMANDLGLPVVCLNASMAGRW